MKSQETHLKNPGVIKFRAKIIDAGGGGNYIEFPHDVYEMFGVKGQVKVKSTFDGVEYRGSLANMGTGCHILIVRKDVREQINKQAGDSVDVVVELDTEERKVEIPELLKKEFSHKKALEKFFSQLAYTHQREYVNYINEAKKEETAKRRVNKVLEMLRLKMDEIK